MPFSPAVVGHVVAQDGFITRTQALEAGMSKAALRHAIRPDGPWQRVAPGVYATFTGTLTQRQLLRAALLSAGPDAMLSGVVACRAHGMRYVPEAAVPLVLVPHRQRAASTSLAAVRRVARMPRARTVSGLAVAPVERAVVDALRHAPPIVAAPSLRDTRALVCESVQRHLTTPERLSAEVAAAPRNGTALLRQALADVTAGCWSAPECEIRDLAHSSHLLPDPVVNTPLPDLDDVTPDGWWREARLAYEVDSVEHHRYGLSPEHTQRRHARMASVGWRVMPISPRRIRTDPKGLLREMEAAYLRGLADQVA